MSMSGLKDFCITLYTPFQVQDLLTILNIQELQEMLLGNFNPYTENLKFPKVTKSLATSIKEF